MFPLKKILFLFFLLSSFAGLEARPLYQGALFDYAHEKDESFQVKKVMKVKASKKYEIYDIYFNSLKWHFDLDVDYHQWSHRLRVYRPLKPKNHRALLFIEGGSHEKDEKYKLEDEIGRMVGETGATFARLNLIPNQPLVFDGDGVGRKEDQILALTWRKAMDRDDPTKMALFPMVKATTRALDVLETVFNRAEFNFHKMNEFVLAGASKRGWTTWLTSTVDKRVMGIIPIVIDHLNMKKSLLNHRASLGKWSFAVQDYVRERIVDRIHSPEMDVMLSHIDPFSYVDHHRIPKLIINASNDQFFTPDSSNFYFHELQGRKYLRYIPNSGHGVLREEVLKSAVPFYLYLTMGELAEFPEMKYSTLSKDTWTVDTSLTPKKVYFYQAINHKVADFRKLKTGMPVYVREEIRVEADQRHFEWAKDRHPKKPGFHASFYELVFEGLVGEEITLTTPIHVSGSASL